MHSVARHVSFACVLVAAVSVARVSVSQIEGTDSGAWHSASALAESRSFCTATLLNDGRVLVAGGQGAGGWLRLAEVYDPNENAWSPIGATAEAHFGHTATRMHDESVLVVGGYAGRYTGAAERFDPHTNAWSAAGTLRIPRDRHTATLLPDGRVVVAGGFTAHGATDSIEIFDPTKNEWYDGPPMPRATAYHIAEHVAPESILFAGGEGSDNYAHAYLFNWKRVAFSMTGALSIPHAYGETSTVCAPGIVLVTGGEPNTSQPRSIALAEVERYDIVSEQWRLEAPMNAPRYFHTATLLHSGHLLVTGGYARREQSAPQATCELFDPQTNRWEPASEMNEGRAEHAAVCLPDGSVLVVGGEGSAGKVLDTAERFTAEQANR